MLDIQKFVCILNAMYNTKLAYHTESCDGVTPAPSSVGKLG